MSPAEDISFYQTCVVNFCEISLIFLMITRNILKYEKESYELISLIIGFFLFIVISGNIAIEREIISLLWFVMAMVFAFHYLLNNFNDWSLDL